MKINAVITPRDLKKKDSDIPQNSIAIISFITSVVSVICGVLFYICFRSKLDEKIQCVFIEFTNDFILKSKPEIFLGLLLSALLFFVSVLLISTSIIGQPLIFIALFIKIMSLAVLISFIYVNYGLKGIEYCILILFPGKFILILAMLIMTDYCVILSKSIRIKLSEENGDVKKHAVRSVVIILLVFFAVATDFITLTVFSGLFDF